MRRPLQRPTQELPRSLWAARKKVGGQLVPEMIAFRQTFLSQTFHSSVLHMKFDVQKKPDSYITKLDYVSTFQWHLDTVSFCLVFSQAART